VFGELIGEFARNENFGDLEQQVCRGKFDGSELLSEVLGHLSPGDRPWVPLMSCRLSDRPFF